MSTWEMLRSRDLITVRADEVLADDILANGATVTSSRRAAKADRVFLDPGRDLWTIRCGKSMSLTTDRDAPIAVYRRPPERPTMHHAITRLGDHWVEVTVGWMSPIAISDDEAAAAAASHLRRLS